jgi:hypothetical protein
VEAVQEWEAQCQGVDTGLTAQLPYSVRDSSTGRVGGTAPGYDSQAVSEGRRGEDSPFDLGARGVLERLMPWSESGRGCHEPGGPRARRRFDRGGRQALERGGDSPEGASGPRARRRFTRGSPRPAA